MKSVVVFIDLFSLLAISLCVVFVLTSGDDDAIADPEEYEVYQVLLGRTLGRIAGEGRPQADDLVVLRPVVCKVTHENSTCETIPIGGDFRMIVVSMFDGFQVTLYNPPHQSTLQVVVEEVRDSRAFTADLDIILNEIYPNSRSEVFHDVRIGAWPDPAINIR